MKLKYTTEGVSIADADENLAFSLPFPATTAITATGDCDWWPESGGCSEDRAGASSGG